MIIRKSKDHWLETEIKGRIGELRELDFDAKLAKCSGEELWHTSFTLTGPGFSPVKRLS